MKNRVTCLQIQVHFVFDYVYIIFCIIMYDRQIKETERGVEHMCREMEEIRAEGREEGRKEGRIEEKRKITKELFNDGMPIAKIAILLSASEETVQKWLL